MRNYQVNILEGMETQRCNKTADLPEVVKGPSGMPALLGPA